MLTQEILDQLKSQLDLGKVLFVNSLPSTNTTAHEWLDGGCPHLSLIAADQQTSGKGRSGRTWYTNPGSALAFSLILTRDLLPISIYPGYIAVSITQALEKFTNAQVEIKWPNDILIEGKKVCGVLNETVWSGETPSGIIIGIGMNVFPPSLEITEELRFPATFLQQNVDEPITRGKLLRQILIQLIDNHLPQRWAELHTIWNQKLAFKGQKIRAVRQEEEEISGMLIGVTPSGELEIALADSFTVLYNANEIQKITPILGDMGTGNESE